MAILGKLVVRQPADRPGLDLGDCLVVQTGTQRTGGKDVHIRRVDAVGVCRRRTKLRHHTFYSLRAHIGDDQLGPCLVQMLGQGVARRPQPLNSDAQARQIRAPERSFRPLP